MLKYIRTSLGTLASLGIVGIDVVEKPTTAYLLQYSERGCLGSCVFCPQSTSSTSSKDLLSRVSWPLIELDKLVGLISSKVFKRVCIQSVIKEDFHQEILNILKALRDGGVDLPISVALTPTSKDYLIAFRGLGVDSVGIGFDAATPKLFKVVRKPYSWDTYIRFLEISIEVFGRGNVYVHLICGLGEDEVDMLKAMKTFYRLGAQVALFAFTPIKGTLAEGWSRPDILTYRKIQLLRHLLSRGYDVDKYVTVVGNRIVLSNSLVNEVINNFNDYLHAFLTSGCPNCNRPFYNESVKGPHYNYPSLNFLLKHKDEVLTDLKRL